MDLRINQNWRIKPDPYCFILEQIGVKGEDTKNPGEEYVIKQTYHSSLQGALDYLVKREVQKSDMADLKAIIQHMDTIRNDIKYALSKLDCKQCKLGGKSEKRSSKNLLDYTNSAKQE